MNGGLDLSFCCPIPGRTQKLLPLNKLKNVIFHADRSDVEQENGKKKSGVFGISFSRPVVKCRRNRIILNLKTSLREVISERMHHGEKIACDHSKIRGC